MKHFRRYLLHALTALSLLLCVAAAALWVRSAFRHDLLSVEDKQLAGPFWRLTRTEIHSSGGRFQASRVTAARVPADRVPANERHWLTPHALAATAADLSWADVPDEGLRWESGDGDVPQAGGGREFRDGVVTATKWRTLRVDPYWRWVSTFALLPLGRLLWKHRHRFTATAQRTSAAPAATT